MNLASSITAAFLAGIGLVVVIVLLSLLLAWPVMALWNGCAVPAVSGLQTIGWLQAWGLMILCGLLFKGSTSTTKSE